MSSVDAYAALEMRIGRVIRAELNEKARKPAYKLWIDFGDHGVKTSSAQITALYGVEDLLNRVVVAIMNLGSRNVAGFESEVLVLGVQNPQGDVVLLAVEQEAPLGAKVH